jgi:hypothetical protein
MDFITCLILISLGIADLERRKEKNLCVLRPCINELITCVLLPCLNSQLITWRERRLEPRSIDGYECRTCRQRAEDDGSDWPRPIVMGIFFPPLSVESHPITYVISLYNMHSDAAISLVLLSFLSSR